MMILMGQDIVMRADVDAENCSKTVHFPAVITQTQKNQLERWTKTVTVTAAVMQRRSARTVGCELASQRGATSAPPTPSHLFRRGKCEIWYRAKRQSDPQEHWNRIFGLPHSCSPAQRGAPCGRDYLKRIQHIQNCSRSFLSRRR